ncbi:hypothetical protein PCASD_07203 [Puccinia coronata f. sp. avenae]|uniref:Peptidase A2 domain-containing protein n=1 Tax=Puccinia coronata f. sp. avenae TaxID=200324 RepID=A0A2N5UUK7_9BASI|nr:hypothetical protein PCASD_07203 [Puccinia coronata f. sp. avenae]
MGPLECYYCKKRHTIPDCEDFAKDYKERKFYKSGGMYYYPNKQPIVVEDNLSVKDMVQKHFEQNQQTASAQTKSEEKEPSSSVAVIEEWGSWIAPSVHIDEEELQTNIGFGLQKSQRIQDKNPAASSQPAPSKPPEPAPMPKEKEPARKRRVSFPGGWVENKGSDKDESMMHTKEKSPTQNPGPEKRRAVNTKPDRTEQLTRHMHESLAKKFYKQTYTLTLEEILKIAPQFLQTLQKSLPETEVLDKSVSIGRIKEDHTDTFPGEEEGKLTYACPLGMIDMNIHNRGIKTLVDTGAEMNIIPEDLANQLGLVTTEIFMRLKGIGGHFTPIIGIAENIEISVFPGYKNLANFFIVKGSVHTVLGRPFLADHNVRLELSNEKGEVLSFQDQQGKRLCIPICLPNSPGWHRDPPGMRQNCSFQVDNWDILNKAQQNGQDQDDIPEIDWEEMEHTESHLQDQTKEKDFQSSLLETIPETPEIEVEEQAEEQTDDPWRVTLAEPVDWAKELGAAQPTEEEQHKIDKEWAESEAAWAREPSPRTTSWKDIPFPRRFMSVFDESTRPKRLRKNQEWLTELPGGASNALDFLQILDSYGELAFLQQGD